MGLIQNLLNRVKGNKVEYNKKFHEAEEQQKIERTLEERAKSSNRRELERHYHEQEEAQIKLELDKIRKQRNKDLWKSNTILKKEKSILTNDRPILKEKNIFKGNKSNMLSKGGMFFHD
jgi:hypothetical protein